MHALIQKTSSLPALATTKREQMLADPRIAQQHVNHQVRRAVRGRPAKGARRQLWKRDVKLWLQQHDRGADWELPKAEQKQLEKAMKAMLENPNPTPEQTAQYKQLKARHTEVRNRKHEVQKALDWTEEQRKCWIETFDARVEDECVMAKLLEAMRSNTD